MELKPTPTRDGFGEEITALGRTNKDIVVVSGDLEDATRAEYFKKEFPERFFNLGIAEQDVVGTAAGLSTQGFVAFATSFAVFLTNRAYDMIRLDIATTIAMSRWYAPMAASPSGKTGPAPNAWKILPSCAFCRTSR